MNITAEQLDRLLSVFLAAHARNTAKVYTADLANFAGFLEVASWREAAGLLLRSDRGGAYEWAKLYQHHLRMTCATSTANRRLAVLRSLVETAGSTGLIGWRLRIRNLRATPLRDTRGPGREAVRRMLVAARAQGGAKAARDVAIIYLLYGMGLRREECIELAYENVDLERPAVSVLGKGMTERQWISMGLEVMEAVAAWMAWRGDADGPLLTSLSRSATGKRISAGGMNYIVGRLGKAAGCKATPHGLRHTAITDAILHGYPLPEVQRFSRHKRLETLQAYYDAVMDSAAEISAGITKGLEQ